VLSEFNSYPITLKKLFRNIRTGSDTSGLGMTNNNRYVIGGKATFRIYLLRLFWGNLD
jgi:hypothetical protein